MNSNRSQALTTPRSIKCKLCNDRFYIPREQTRMMTACRCLQERKLADFLAPIPPSPKEPSHGGEFAALDPLSKALIITGSLDEAHALLRGFLAHRCGNLRFTYLDTVGLAKAYVGDPGAPCSRWDLEEVPLLIVYLSPIIPSEDYSQMVFDYVGRRATWRRPTWLVTQAVDRHLRHSYTGYLMSLLHGEHVGSLGVIRFDADSGTVQLPNPNPRSASSHDQLPPKGPKVFTPLLGDPIANGEDEPIHPPEHYRPFLENQERKLKRERR